MSEGVQIVTAAPAPGLGRYRMTLAYDGGPFRGFAQNHDVRTVEGTLRAAMGQILGEEPRLSVAGRTDAGVHAWGQVLSFDAAPLDPGRFQRSLNRMCAPAIAVRDLAPASDDFDARFSATQRTYRYQVLNSPTPNPFQHARSWHIHKPLDLDAMAAAAADVEGEHDFASFCRARMVWSDGAEISATLERNVHSCRLQRQDGGIVELWISARAFCHQMVRSLTGTLVDIGLGYRAADAMPAILEARDRAAAGRVAPPYGLTLWSVAYDDEAQ